MSGRWRWVGVTAVSLAALQLVGAQRRTVVAGTVRDDGGRPVGAIEVATDGGARTATDSLGRFELRVDDCEPVRVGVRRPGSIAASRVVAPCTEAGRGIALVLRPLTGTLGTVRVTERTSGFLGLVTDVSGAPIPGASVRLVGARQTTRTDSTGRFVLLGADSGTYMLRVTAPGHRLGLLTTTLGRGDVRDVQLYLGTIPVETPRRAAERLARGPDDVQLREFESRLVNRGPTAAIVTREVLMARDDGRRLLTCTLARIPEVWRAVPTLTLGTCATYEACVIVDGLVARNNPLWGYDTDEVEMIELYGPRGDFTNTIGIRAPECRGRTVAVVWLRA